MSWQTTVRLAESGERRERIRIHQDEDRIYLMVDVGRKGDVGVDWGPGYVLSAITPTMAMNLADELETAAGKATVRA